MIPTNPDPPPEAPPFQYMTLKLDGPRPGKKAQRRAQREAAAREREQAAVAAAVSNEELIKQLHNMAVEEPSRYAAKIAQAREDAKQPGRWRDAAIQVLAVHALFCPEAIAEAAAAEQAATRAPG